MIIGNKMLLKSKAHDTMPDHIVGIAISTSQMIWSTDGFVTYTTRNSVSEPIYRVQGNGKSVLAYLEGNLVDSSRVWYFTVDYGQNWKTAPASGNSSYSQGQVDFMASDSGQYIVMSGYNQSGSLQWAKYSTDYGDNWTYVPTDYMHLNTWGQIHVAISGDGQYAIYSQRSDLFIKSWNYFANFANAPYTTNDGNAYAMISPNGQYQIMIQEGSWTPYYVYTSQDYGSNWSSFSAGSSTSYRPYYPYITNSGIKQFWWGGYNKRYLWNGSTFVADTGGSLSQNCIGVFSDDAETYDMATTHINYNGYYNVIVDGVDTGIDIFSWLYGIFPLREGGVVFICDTSNNIQVTTNGGGSWSTVRNLGATPAHLMFTNYGKTRN